MVATVWHLFLDAISIHSLPFSVPADFNAENVHVARVMSDYLEHGINRGRLIASFSVHNQRIDLVWGEVIKCAVRDFRHIIFFLENERFLDPLNEVHVFALHYIYMPRINKAPKSLATIGYVIHYLVKEINHHTNFGITVWLDLLL